MSNTVPLVWLPGLLCTHDLYRNVNDLLPNWVEPNCIELPALNSMQQLAKHVLETLPPKFVLGGLSMGGILCFEVFKQAPERVLGLVLLDTIATDETEDISDKRDAIVRKAEAGQFNRITRDVLLPMLVHPTRATDEALVSRLEEMANDVGLEAFKAHARALATRPNAVPLLENVQVPTIVVTGKQDLLCPLNHHLEIVKHLSDVSLHVIPNCGHLTTLEAPATVANLMSNWFAHHQRRFV
ncbi:alpha/beta fold hydrolase [Vibrio paucivorans]